VARLSFLEVAAADGVPLAASFFAPDGRDASGVVVIASATGVPCGFVPRALGLFPRRLAGPAVAGRRAVPVRGCRLIRSLL
jgi:predicted alpha/beta hydrolase